MVVATAATICLMSRDHCRWGFRAAGVLIYRFSQTIKRFVLLVQSTTPTPLDVVTTYTVAAVPGTIHGRIWKGSLEHQQSSCSVTDASDTLSRCSNDTPSSLTLQPPSAVVRACLCGCHKVRDCRSVDDEGVTPEIMGRTAYRVDHNRV